MSLLSLVQEPIPTPAPQPAPPAPPPEVFIPDAPPPWVFLEPEYIVLITLAALIIGGIVLYPLMRALARRLEGRRTDDAELRAELEDLRTRLTALEGARGELEERLDFTERLLAQAREPDRLAQRGGQ